MEAASKVSDSKDGFLAAMAGYLLWGIVPLFWKQLEHIPAFELINHRIIWTAFILLAAILISEFFGQKKWRQFIRGFQTFKSFSTILLTTTLISLNWFLFIWAVNANHILDTSLGYYINPIINILMGHLLLKEQLSRLQKWAVYIAGIGVLYLIVSIGYLPWISLALAISFALYGYVRKLSPIDPVTGLAQEATMLTIPSLFYLYYLESLGQSAFGHTAYNSIMLILCGLVTLVPLLLFLFSLKRIKLSTIGILQFITPTATFFLAIFYYNEPFEPAKLIAFLFIWTAVAIYISDLKIKRGY